MLLLLLLVKDISRSQGSYDGCCCGLAGNLAILPSGDVFRFWDYRIEAKDQNILATHKWIEIY